MLCSCALLLQHDVLVQLTNRLIAASCVLVLSKSHIAMQLPKLLQVSMPLWQEQDNTGLAMLQALPPSQLPVVVELRPVTIKCKPLNLVTENTASACLLAVVWCVLILFLTVNGSSMCSIKPRTWTQQDQHT